MKADNRGVTYRPDFKPIEVLIEVYGAEYVALAYKKEQDKQVSLRNAKLMLIDGINKCRKLMGENPCVDSVFWQLYDMDIDELQTWAQDYDRQAFEYSHRNNML